jgi:tetratricopeptide (TPR) repeat protein
MKPWKKLFSKNTEIPKARTPSVWPPNQVSQKNLNQRIDQLWEIAMKLGGSIEDLKKQVDIYTELLSLVDEKSTQYNLCAILRHRAIAYRDLKDYDSALTDLGREMYIAQKRQNHTRVMECRKIIAETEEQRRKAQILASGGEKAIKLRTIEERVQELINNGPDFESAFNRLFDDLTDNDADINAEASQGLANTWNALKKLSTIYQDSLNSDPKRASLAGRVLSRKLMSARDSNGYVRAPIVQQILGFSASFIPCACIYCGYLNAGIAAPPNGPVVPYYHQMDDKGAYAVPVLCDKCGKEFFVVWDTDPR